MSQNDYFVHESSYVDEPCSIGAGTKIWHFSHVMKNCRIGERCNIGQNVVVSPDVVIGNNVKIQNNVSVYTGCILEDDVFCGPSMVFTNVINPRSHVMRKNEYKTHPGEARGFVRRQLHGRLRHHHRALRVYRRGRRGDPRCSGLCFDGGQPRARAAAGCAPAASN